MSIEGKLGLTGVIFLVIAYLSFVLGQIPGWERRSFYVVIPSASLGSALLVAAFMAVWSS